MTKHDKEQNQFNNYYVELPCLMLPIVFEDGLALIGALGVDEGPDPSRTCNSPYACNLI